MPNFRNLWLSNKVFKNVSIWKTFPERLLITFDGFNKVLNFFRNIILRKKKGLNYFVLSWWYVLHWSPSWHVSLCRWTRGTCIFCRQSPHRSWPIFPCRCIFRSKPSAPQGSPKNRTKYLSKGVSLSQKLSKFFYNSHKLSIFLPMPDAFSNLPKLKKSEIFRSRFSNV